MTSKLRHAWYVFVRCLAVFGTIGLVAHLFLYFLFGTTFRDFRVMPEGTAIHSYPGPDGLYKAVLFTDAGGGGLSPYCILHLNVVRASVPDVLAWGADNNVVVTGCDGIDDVTWKSGHSLQVKINPTLGATGVDAMSLKAYADGDVVQMIYVQN